MNNYNSYFQKPKTIYKKSVFDEIQTFGADEVVFMKVGEKKDLIVNIPLTDEDIENNPNVNI